MRSHGPLGLVLLSSPVVMVLRRWVPPPRAMVRQRQGLQTVRLFLLVLLRRPETRAPLGVAGHSNA